MSEPVYIYKQTIVGEDGNMKTVTVEDFFENLKEKYWQNWADMRTVMQMPVNNQEFIDDLKVILKMEEV